MKHKEAFCFMEYENERTGETHLIWNSRNGTTPFAFFHEGDYYHHTNWQKDCFAPDHIPADGEWVFADLTFEELLEYKRDYVDQWWNDGPFPLQKQWKSQEEAAKELAEYDWERFPGTPKLRIADDGFIEFCRGKLQAREVNK